MMPANEEPTARTSPLGSVKWLHTMIRRDERDVLLAAVRRLLAEQPELRRRGRP
jgi:hypothetical protein